MRANSPAELDAAIARLRALLSRVDVRAHSHGLEDVVLVEGFIAGREFAVEGVLTDGALQVFAIFDKPDPLDGPFFEETIYVTPSALAERGCSGRWSDRCSTRLMRSASPTGRSTRSAASGPDGDFHARSCGAADRRAVLEGAAVQRPAMTERSVSLEEVLLRHAVGEDISAICARTVRVGVMMIPIPRQGLLKRVHGTEPAAAVGGIEEVRITAKPDQLLEPLPEAGSYLGFIFARANRRRPS